MSQSNTYTGIDYGLGRTNIDQETGIRYGVISQHTVGERWYDAAEPQYGDPTCPKCGAIVHPARANKDYRCRACRANYWSDEVYGEEPIGYTFEDSEYSITDCLDSDIMICRSPYYTFAQFCSPCVPGAGNLDTPMPDGVKTYCLGADWFEDDRAPYPVYRVSDDSLVLA